MRWANPRRDPVAGGHRRYRRARRRATRRVLGGARRAVPALGAGARSVPESVQALSTLHSDGGARCGRPARDRWRARRHELLSRSQLLGELDHPGVAAQAPVARVRVHVRVPATSANLGPGFDALGLALALHNEVVAEERDGVTVTIEGEGADRLARDANNVVARGVKLAYEAAGRPFKGCALECVNRIPAARGLGSSAAAWVGGLAAGNALLGSPLSRERLLALAAQAEGHPDNVAAAIFGGLTVSCGGGDSVTAVSLPVPTSI